MKQTFKQFNAFVSASDEEIESLSEEQLNEIFGLFKNNQKYDQAKAQREKLKQALDAKKADEKKKKEELWKKAKERADAHNGGFNTQERGSGTFRSQAAMGRSAELDWVRGATSESAKHVVDAIVEGNLAIHQVFHEPVGRDQREVSLHLKEAVKRFKVSSEEQLLEAAKDYTTMRVDKMYDKLMAIVPKELQDDLDDSEVYEYHVEDRDEWDELRWAIIDFVREHKLEDLMNSSLKKK